MKRLALTLTIVALAGAAWTAFEPFRTKHPVTGKDITVPGQNGSNALLVSGWKTTPAGRQLASGDMGTWKDADQQHYKAEMIAWLKQTLTLK